jgi:uridine kinase
MRALYDESVSVFLEVSDEVRFERFTERRRTGDPEVDFGAFVSVSDATVEADIASVREVADLVIDASGTREATVMEVFTSLERRGFVPKQL